MLRLLGYLGTDWWLATGQLETAGTVNREEGFEAWKQRAAKASQQAANRQRHKASGPAQVGPLGRAASTACRPASRRIAWGRAGAPRYCGPSFYLQKAGSTAREPGTGPAAGYFQFSQLPHSSQQPGAAAPVLGHSAPGAHPVSSGSAHSAAPSTA